MRSTSIVAAGLLVAGSGVVVVQAVRAGILWSVGPGSEYVAPAGAVLLAAGIAVPALRRARPAVAVAALVLAGIVCAALSRLVVALAFDGGAGRRYATYGPGAPPSISWSLLAVQVVGPALAVLSLSLIAVGAVSAVVLALRARRLRTG